MLLLSFGLGSPEGAALQQDTGRSFRELASLAKSCKPESPTPYALHLPYSPGITEEPWIPKTSLINPKSHALHPQPIAQKPPSKAFGRPKELNLALEKANL